MTNSDSRRQVLGKGLSALIPKNPGGNEQREYLRLPLDRIDIADAQPRTNFEPQAIKDLSESIVESGLIQPLIVREKNGRYELIAGERRLRACRLAGLKDVPVVVKDVDDVQAYTLALIENIQREDLNALEEALALDKLLTDSKLTQSELAQKVGKSRAAVANAVRLLQLPTAIQEQVVAGLLSAGHARALIGLDDAEAIELAARVIEEGWSVRETEHLVREIKDGIALLSTFEEKEDDTVEQPVVPEPRKSTYRDDAQIRHMTDRLQHTIGAKVRIKDRRGKGRIEIYYDDYDSLQTVLESLGMPTEE